MSNVEKQIRSLNLRAPSEAMDARVFLLLNASNESGSSATGSQDATFNGSSVNAASSNPASPNGSGHSPVCVRDAAESCSPANRRGAILTSGWLVACTSMILGGLVGNALPSILEFDSGHSQTLQAENVAESREPLQSAQSHNLSAMNTVPDMGGSDGRKSNIASQIVESIWMSPAAAAVVWEQQTGQIFNVVNHVNDRRFDMCRDCHRVGG
jgi:hypothetical protein